MTYVIGAAAGLILGGLAGHVKNILLWKKYLQRSNSANTNPNEAGSVYGRMTGSFLTNIVTLVAAFFLMNVLPFSGTAFLIGTAAGLVIMNKILVAKQKKWEAMREEAAVQ